MTYAPDATSDDGARPKKERAPKPRMPARDRRDAGPHARHLPADPQLHRPAIRGRAGLDVADHPGARVRPDRQALAALQRLRPRRHRGLPAAGWLRAGRRAVHQARHRPAGRHGLAGERPCLRHAAGRITGARWTEPYVVVVDGDTAPTQPRDAERHERVDRARRPVLRDGRQPAGEPGLALLRADRAATRSSAARGCATSRSIASASWRSRSTRGWTRPIQTPAALVARRSAIGAAAPRPRSRRPPPRS